VLTGTTNLTVDAGGEVNIDANGSTLTNLTVTKRTIADVDSFSLSGLGGGQSVSLNGGSTELEVEVSSIPPLNFTLFYTTGDDILLVNSGISTGGGNVTLISGGGINASAGGITSGGSDVFLQASGGGITTGTISAGTGQITAQTFCASCNIDVSGALTGFDVFLSASDGNIAGIGTITATSSVIASTSNGTIGTNIAPLAINAPSVFLSANRGFGAIADEGMVWASLANTSAFDLTGAYGFDVTSNTAFNSLSVATRGSGLGAVNLATPGQNFSFARVTNDLFGPVTNTFQVVSVGGTPISSTTFSILDGMLLVAGPGTINSTNLTLFSQSGADISLQGTAANPLTLSNTVQNFFATGGTAADILIRGAVVLSAGTSQTLSATGSIIVNADAGGGGGISISSPDQFFQTSSSSSTMQFLGGAAAGESVNIAATNNQTFRISTSSSSPDSLKFKGGSGSGAFVSANHTGSGFQQVQINGGTVTVEGGSGLNAFAEIKTNGSNEQQICRDIPFQGCVPVGTLNVLGGSGAGSYAQVVSSGAQEIGASSAFNIIAGTGDGAHAMLQAGAGASQQIFGGGNLTLEGKGGPGAVAKGEILASGFQSLSVGNVVVKAGNNAGSLARIATTSNQTISASSLTLSAGGAGSTSGPAVPNASAIVEGHNQSISSFGALSLNGGFGTIGNTSDAILRNLSGSQTVFASGLMTLTGGHEASTTGILNLGTGSQSVTGSGGILLRSDISFPPASADTLVLIENNAAALQTINASNGGLTLVNSGAGTVSVTSADRQNVTARYVDVSTSAGSTGSSTISAVGNQRIHTTNGTFGPNGSMRVAALGTGTASILSGASQLIELDYPEQMQFTRDGSLTIGDVNALGTSLVHAIDQSVFASNILIQSGGANSVSKLSADNTQTITTLQGGIDILGGSGANSLATIDPLSQTILSNGLISLLGGSGTNAFASIVSAGSQLIFTSNGDISILGGTGTGADAFIISAGSPQTIFASGSIILLPVTGNAFIGGPPSAILLAFDTTSLTLPLQEDQYITLADIALGDGEDPLFRRGVPICR
jgi:hypothetical protein